MGYDFIHMFCLWAEDNTCIGGVLHILMDSENVRNYNFVQGGKEAVEIIRLCLGPLKGADGGIDCVISDVLMPGIYGHMPLRWIRRLEHSPDRRRSKDYAEKERRKLVDSDCEIVYSGKDPGKFRKYKRLFWLFRMPNR